MIMNTRGFTFTWIMMILGASLWGISICGATSESEYGMTNLAERLGRVWPYSELSFLGTARLIEMPTRNDAGRVLIKFEIIENLMGKDGILVMEANADMLDGPKGSYPGRIPHGTWEVGTVYHFMCRKGDNWLGWMMTSEDWQSTKKYLQSLGEEDVERSQQHRVKQEDLDRLYEELTEEQRKGYLTRQEVRERMVERMKYYQDQEEPQIVY